MRICYIYKITSPSGRIYIGQTVNPKSRKRQYKNGFATRQPAISNSIIKYGWDKHKFEIIDSCTEDKIDELEIFYIEKYKSNKNLYPDSNGLNLSSGGNGTRGINRGYMINRNKVVKYCGERNGMFGKKRQDLADRNRMRKITGEMTGINNPKSKSVIDLKTGKVYGSIRIAADDVGINYSTARYYLQNPDKNTSSLTYEKTN